MKTYHVDFFVNGEEYELDVPANKTALNVIRDMLDLTVEGFADEKGNLSPIQQSFIDHAALQCGYCTPGFIVSATALLRENPHPTRDEIVHYMSGNLCRCTGYKRIIEAIEDAAERMNGGAK